MKSQKKRRHTTYIRLVSTLATAMVCAAFSGNASGSDSPLLRVPPNNVAANINASLGTAGIAHFFEQNDSSTMPDFYSSQNMVVDYGVHSRMGAILDASAYASIQYAEILLLTHGPLLANTFDRIEKLGEGGIENMSGNNFADKTIQINDSTVARVDHFVEEELLTESHDTVGKKFNFTMTVDDAVFHQVEVIAASGSGVGSADDIKEVRFANIQLPPSLHGEVAPRAAVVFSPEEGMAVEIAYDRDSSQHLDSHFLDRPDNLPRLMNLLHPEQQVVHRIQPHDGKGFDSPALKQVDWIIRGDTKAALLPRHHRVEVRESK